MSETQAQGVQLSTAVAAQLTEASKAGNLGEFSFQARHKTLPIFTREQLKSLQVTTRFRGDSRVFASRGRVQHDYLIEVMFQQGIESEESLLVDKLILTAEKIGDFYERDDTDTGQTRTVIGREEKLVGPVETQFSDEMLNQLKVIKCSVMLTFRGWR